MPSPADNLDAVAQPLLSTLRREQEALANLDQQLARQLDALRSNALDDLTQASLQVHDVACRLERLRQTRRRQVRLLRRVLDLPDDDPSLEAVAAALEARTTEAGAALRTARAALREQAAAARRHGEELEFALNYAVDLGRDMLGTFQRLYAPAPARLYTATGDSTSPKAPSLVNKMG